MDLKYKPPSGAGSAGSEQLLGFLEPRAIRGVEWVEARQGLLRRSLRMDGSVGWVECRVIPEGVRIGCGGEGGFEKRLNEIGVKARRVLDIDAPAEELEKMFPGRGGVRVPGAWDEFEMGVRAILGQQVTVKAAHTLAGRLAERWGRKLVTPWEEVGLVFPEAELVAELAVEELRAIGLTRQRAETVKSFAGWMAEGQIGDMEALPGIGPWTRAYFDMRSGRDRDAFPAGDLGVQKALGIRERGTGKAKRLAEARAEKWRPWRAYAVMLLWTGGMPDEADTGM